LPRTAQKQNRRHYTILARLSHRPHAVQTRRLGANLWFVLALALVAACRVKHGVNQKTFPYLEKLSPAPRVRTNLSSLQNDTGQWVMPAKDYASTRVSPLDQINSGNAANLKVAWTFSMANDRGEEAAPLIVNNTMFVVSPFPNIH
jgi:glucose dehydrogenase